MPESEEPVDERLLAELTQLNNEYVTIQRRAVKELAEGKVRTEDAKRFVGMLAHDMRTPLQVILGYVGLLLQDESLTPAQLDKAGRIERSGRSLLALVDDLTESIVDDAKPRLDLALVDVADLVASVVARHQVLTAARDVSITEVVDSHGDPVRRPIVNGDVMKLERVLNNLIGNAVKFSPPGGVVTVLLRTEDARVDIRVSDQGPGIDPARHEAVFLPFHREEGTEHVPGLGLGLAIARQIVELHGGTLALDSELGKGAHFTVTLALADD